MTDISSDLGEALSLLHKIIAACFIRPHAAFIRQHNDNTIENSISAAYSTTRNTSHAGETSVFLLKNPPPTSQALNLAIERSELKTRTNIDKRFHAMEQCIKALSDKNAAVERSLKKN